MLAALKVQSVRCRARAADPAASPVWWGQTDRVRLSPGPDGEQCTEVSPGDLPEDWGVPADSEGAPGGERHTCTSGHDVTVFTAKIWIRNKSLTTNSRT